MSEGITCYERDEVLCEDQMCLRMGCALRNKRVQSEETLRAGLEDAIAAFGLLEATLRQFKQEPVADIVMQFKNKASAALARADEDTANQ